MNHLRNPSHLLVFAALLASCGEEADDKSFDAATEGTLGLVVRDVGGQPISGTTTEIGFQNTATDPVGMARYPELLGGRLTVRATAAGFTGGTAVTQQTAGAFGSAKMTLAPLQMSEHDPAADAFLGDADLAVMVPAGAVVHPDATPAVGTVTFGWYRGGDADPAVPGMRTWLRDDQFEEPIDLLAAFEIGAPEQTDAYGETTRLELAEAVQYTVRWTVGDAWPHAADANLGLYVYDRNPGYWMLSRRLSVVDGVIETTSRHLGWTAIGAQPAETACISGRVSGATGPVSGVEITAAEAGHTGVQRAITGADGVFCAVVHPGADVALTAWGWNAAGDALGTGAAASTSGAAAACGSCVDVGDVPMTWALDRDQDVFWAGEGDCDDADPAVNPIDSGDICIGG